MKFKFSFVKVLSLVVGVFLSFSEAHMDVFAIENNSTLCASSLDSCGKYPEVEGEELVLQLNMDTGKQKEVNNVPSYNSLRRLYGVSLPNLVFIAITPKSSSYKITVFNLGIDSVDSVKLNCKIYDYSGTYLKGKTKTLRYVKPGNTKWTWSVKKGETVQEKINVTGTARDGKAKTSFSGSTVRYNFAGGKYGTMKAYDGERHHMPSKNASPLTAYSGPAIRMIKSEHAETASYGNKASAKEFRAKEKAKIKAGKFLEAQRLGILDVQKQFGAKYNKAINSMVAYTESLGYTK